MAENVRALMDRLAQQAAARRAVASTPGAAAPPAPTIEGLVFRPGDRILELATGRRGKVIAGARGEDRALQVFEISLETGETVYRTNTELAPDVLPRSPAIR